MINNNGFSEKKYREQELINDYLNNAWYVVSNEELCLLAKQLYERQMLKDKIYINKQCNSYNKQHNYRNIASEMREKYGEKHGGDIGKAKLYQGKPEWMWEVI